MPHKGSYKGSRKSKAYKLATKREKRKNNGKKPK